MGFRCPSAVLPCPCLHGCLRPSHSREKSNLSHTLQGGSATQTQLPRSIVLFWGKIWPHSNKIFLWLVIGVVAPGYLGWIANCSFETNMNSSFLPAWLPSSLSFLFFLLFFLTFFPWRPSILWSSPGLHICLNLKPLPTWLSVGCFWQL